MFFLKLNFGPLCYLEESASLKSAGLPWVKTSEQRKNFQVSNFKYQWQEILQTIWYVRTATRHHRENSFRISHVVLLIATSYDKNITWSIYLKWYVKCSNFTSLVLKCFENAHFLQSFWRMVQNSAETVHLQKNSTPGK